MPLILNLNCGQGNSRRDISHAVLVLGVQTEGFADGIAASTIQKRRKRLKVGIVVAFRGQQLMQVLAECLLPGIAERVRRLDSRTKPALPDPS